MHLSPDQCRCLGDYERRVCDRAHRCARHLALHKEPQAQYTTCVALLCYSGYTFFLEASRET